MHLNLQVVMRDILNPLWYYFKFLLLPIVVYLFYLNFIYLSNFIIYKMRLFFYNKIKIKKEGLI
jgi:hypothetical protein